MSNIARARNNAQRARGRGNRRHKHVAELLLPTAPNQYGTVALIDSDLSPTLVKALSAYDTIGDQTFLWRASADGQQPAQVALTDAMNTYNFRLSQFTGYADWAGAFDLYRLRGIAIEFAPNITVGTTTNILPRLYTVIDYDDSASVTRAQALQYDTCVVSPPGTGVVRTLTPRLAVAAYSGTFTSYANMKAQWIDVASPDVQHYGVKIVVEGGASGQMMLQSYSCTITGFWEFRSAR